MTHSHRGPQRWSPHLQRGMGGVRTLQGVGWETAFLTLQAVPRQLSSLGLPAGPQTRCSLSNVSTDTSRSPREQAPLLCTQTQHTVDASSIKGLKGLCLCVCAWQLEVSGPSFRTLPDCPLTHDCSLARLHKCFSNDRMGVWRHGGKCLSKGLTTTKFLWWDVGPGRPTSRVCILHASRYTGPSEGARLYAHLYPCVLRTAGVWPRCVSRNTEHFVVSPLSVGT